MILVSTSNIRKQINEIISDNELRIIGKVSVSSIVDRHIANIREVNLREVLKMKGCKKHLEYTF